MKIYPFVSVKGLFRGAAILLETFGWWVGFTAIGSSDIDIGGKVFKCDHLAIDFDSIWIPVGFQAETDRFTGLFLSVGVCVLPLTQQNFKFATRLD